MLFNVEYQCDLAPPEAFFRVWKAKYKKARLNAFANDIKIDDNDLAKDVLSNISYGVSKSVCEAGLQKWQQPTMREAIEFNPLLQKRSGL